MQADLGPVGEDSDHVEAQGFEVWLSGVEVVFGYGAQGMLLAVGNGFQWVSEAGPAPQFDFHEDERLGSNIQNTMASEVRFHAELSEDGAERLELALAKRALRTRLHNSADTRLRILESANGSRLRFRARLSGDCAVRLEVTKV